MSDQYQPIPTAVAKQIAERYNKSIVIICAFDPEHGMLHTTTYGASEQDKALAADGGEIAAKALGTMPDQATFYENYRKHCCLRSGHVTMNQDRQEIRCAAHPAVEP